MFCAIVLLADAGCAALFAEENMEKVGCRLQSLSNSRRSSRDRETCRLENNRKILKFFPIIKVDSLSLSLANNVQNADESQNAFVLTDL